VKTVRTGEVARLAGVNVQTLRYYERRGLLPRPVRTSGGHRVYAPATVGLLRTIKAAQGLGFTLDEIALLLASGRRPSLRGRAVTKIAEVDAKIEELSAARTTLATIVAAGCDDLTDCSCPPGTFQAVVSGGH
jgi:MerR family transcriptional regulator, mercuric resistance operon regulatory protein